MSAAERHGPGRLYDRIGAGYAGLRRPDPRIRAALRQALGDAASVVNVGAGAGSYEPEGVRLVAVEPSRTMIDQRSQGAAPVLRASANALPFASRCFDAALAILTLHHWPDWRRGLAELDRVAERVVLLTFDPWAKAASRFWLFDYFPEIARVDRAIFPTLAEQREQLGPVDVVPVPIPRDCTDGFLGAYWRRPHAYLDPDVRHAISTFARISVGSGLAALRADLADGAWERRYASLLGRDSLDLGYRIVVQR